MQGVAQPDVAAGDSWSFRTVMLCTTGGAVTITGVSAADPIGGAVLSWWGVRPNPFTPDRPAQEGAVPGRFPDSFGFVTGDAASVQGSCPDTGQLAASDNVATDVSELAVTMTKPGALTASAQGVIVGYSSGGSAGTLLVNYGISLCRTGDTTGHCG